MANKKKDTHQPFESTTERGRYIKVCGDMVESPAFNRLNMRQQGLYYRFKNKYRQTKVNGIVTKSNINDISFTYKEASELGYSEKRTFQKDVKALIDNGFIKIVSQGGKNYYDGEKSRFSATIYGFSEEWKKIK